MKKILNIENKKADMTDIELQKIMAAELIAEIKIKESKTNGYIETNPVCINSTKEVKKILKIGA